MSPRPGGSGVGPPNGPVRTHHRQVARRCVGCRCVGRSWAGHRCVGRRCAGRSWARADPNGRSAAGPPPHSLRVDPRSRRLSPPTGAAAPGRGPSRVRRCRVVRGHLVRRGPAVRLHQESHRGPAVDWSVCPSVGPWVGRILGGALVYTIRGVNEFCAPARRLRRSGAGPPRMWSWATSPCLPSRCLGVPRPGGPSLLPTVYCRTPPAVREPNLPVVQDVRSPPLAVDRAILRRPSPVHRAGPRRRRLGARHDRGRCRSDRILGRDRRRCRAGRILRRDPHPSGGPRASGPLRLVARPPGRHRGARREEEKEPCCETSRADRPGPVAQPAVTSMAMMVPPPVGARASVAPERQVAPAVTAGATRGESPAATYSPRGSRPKYHRRGRA